jgi:hypothetical protein
MSIAGIHISRRILPLAVCALALGITALVVGLNRQVPAAPADRLASASQGQVDRSYLEWEVSKPLPEPTIAPTPRAETDRGVSTPATEETDLLLSLAAGPAQVAASRRDLDAPAPTALASNLSPGERAELLKQEVLRERPARRTTPGPRFAIAIVEDNCEPPTRPLP